VSRFCSNGAPWKQLFSGALLAGHFALFGCEDEPLSRQAGPPGTAPDLVSLAATSMQSGFTTGTVRLRRSIPAFGVTKHPVTWTQYDACVRAGSCASPDASACGSSAYQPYAGYTIPDYRSRSENAPASCVGVRQAEAYCRWIGGRLPTLDEWLLAARGEAPTRFAWGDLPTGCEQHPLAPQLLEKSKQGQLAAGASPDSCPSGSAPLLSVGSYSAGRAPSGMEDVLLLPGELLRGDKESVFNACGNDDGHCVVFGLEPAAIDSVEPFFKRPRSAGETADSTSIAHAYAFRCVLTANSEKTP
jgi:hypothetical protein